MLAVIAFVSGFFFVLGTCDNADWKITATKNPECTDHCEQHDIWYIRASNTTSSVHSFICASTSFPAPAILIIHSSNNETIGKVNWHNTNLSSTPTIKVDSVTQSYSIVLHKLIEYNDESDNVTVSWVPPNPKFAQMHYFSDWQWGPSQTSQDQNLSSIWHFNYTGTGTDAIFGKSGKVTFKVMLSRSQQTNPQMPHLKFIPGLELQFELALVNLTTNYTNGRFATQLALLSNHGLAPSQEFGRESRFSIDDEITPGTFEVIDLMLGDSVFANNGSSSVRIHPPAYLQTKPICFIDSEYREIKTSRDVLVATHQDKPSPMDMDHISKALVQAYYGDRLKPNPQHPDKAVGIRLLNVSFGTVADGFYANSHHLVWTASFGLGEPPVQRLSALIIGLIVLSIVIVICSILFGTLLILIIRARQRRHQFSLLRETGSQENLTGEPTATA